MSGVCLRSTGGHGQCVCTQLSSTYIALVFKGRRWMQNRKPYNLNKSLILWNIGLAVFSTMGAASYLPKVLYTTVNHGVSFSEGVGHPIFGLWGYVFGLSKLVELGDTAFLILRKSPLPFLHWYHQVTVLIYTMYSLTDPYYHALGTIFIGMNYFVHSLMYSYYAGRALGVRIPRWIAQIITFFQLSQMFVGVYVTVLAFYNVRSGRVPGCTVRDEFIYWATAMYFSYALLFLHFFYKRYCSSSRQKSKLI